MPTDVQRRRAADAIVRLCAADLDSLVLRQELVAVLRRAVPFDGAVITALDPTTLHATHSLRVDRPVEQLSRLLELEALVEDFNKFAALAKAPRPVGILSQATGGKLDRSPRYREHLAPEVLGDELRAACVVGSGCWGRISLVRGGRAARFDEQDAAVIARATGSIARGLRRAHTAPAVAWTAEEGDAPGLIVFDRHNRVAATTRAGEHYLDELADGGRVPQPIYEVVLHARSDPSVHIRHRVRTHEGRWVTVHAALLRERSNAGRLAIVVEPARREEIVPLVLAAYELTRREQEIAQLLLAGRSTKAIASLHHLSPHTVEGYVKTIFKRVGVHSRGELIAKLASVSAPPGR